MKTTREHYKFMEKWWKYCSNLIVLKWYVKTIGYDGSSVMLKLGQNYKEYDASFIFGTLFSV